MNKLSVLSVRVFLNMFISAVIINLILFFTMSQFYVNIFFSVMVLICFIFGILTANILELLLQIKKINLVYCTISIMLLGYLGFLLFPYAYKTVFIHDYIRTAILLIIFILSFPIYFLLRIINFSEYKFPINDIWFVLILNIVFVFVLQTYGYSPFSGIWLYLLLFFIALCSLISRLLHFLLTCCCFLILSITLFFVQEFHFFYINTSETSYNQFFDLGIQIDFQNSELMNKSSLDISDAYQGKFPTAKTIFLNGRYYGELVGDLDGVDYAKYTPYNVVYGLKNNPRVLILNSAGGSAVYLTHKLINGEIDALESNQEVINQIRDKESLYVGGIYHNRNTLFYRSSVRPYITTTDKTYDIIDLNYTITKTDQLVYLMEKEQVFTEKTLDKYFDILNPQGILYVKLNSFNKEFNNILATKLINTFIHTKRYPSEQILDHIQIFRTQNSVNILFLKTAFSDEQSSLYQQSITNLEFQNVLEDNNFTNSIQALIAENKNIISEMKYDSSPISDAWSLWYIRLTNQLHLWGNELFGLKFFQNFLYLGLIVCFGIFLYTRFFFIKTNLYKMGLGSFFIYFMLFGIILGLSIDFSLDLFTYLLSNDFISSGWCVATVVVSCFLNFFFFSGIQKAYTKILVSFILQIIINIILIFTNLTLREYAIALPLVLKVLTPILFSIMLHLFLWSLGFYPFIWVSYIQSKDSSFLRTVLIVGIIFGVCLGYLLLLYMSSTYLLIISTICLILSFILIIFLDVRSKEIDYTYAKNRI